MNTIARQLHIAALTMAIKQNSRRFAMLPQEDRDFLAKLTLTLLRLSDEAAAIAEMHRPRTRRELEGLAYAAAADETQNVVLLPVPWGRVS